MSTASTVFGIDLGTTYSCIAYVDEVGKPVVIPNEENELVTPSVVYFESTANIIVGKIAKEAARVHPGDTVELVKRSMGDGNFRRLIHGHEYRPEEISSIILRKLKNDAERQVGTPVTDVVITVPAYFNEAQRTATEQAGILAGLNVRGIIPEPTAAAIAYALTDQSKQNVLVYDLGGGTFDVTVMEIGDGNVRVVCIGGDHDLGGRNWDEQVVAYFAEEWKRQTGRFDEPLDDAETAQEFLNLAEMAKRRLTRVPKTPVSLTHAGDKARVELTRQRFDELTSWLLERTISLTRDTLQEAGRKGVGKIQRIILVGGSSYMPQVSARLRAEVGLDCELFDPEQAVAKGAAIYASNRMIQDVYAAVLRDLFGSGSATAGEAPALAAPAPAALSLELVLDSDPQGYEPIVLPPLEVLPPELQQQVMDEVQDRLVGFDAEKVDRSLRTRIVNACSKNFGVVALDEAGAEQVVYLIRKNEQVPATVERDFETVEHDQENVLIRIIEADGESPATKPDSPECREIKTSTLNLPPGLPKGSLISVRYSLSDDGGRLRVVATEKKTGRTIEVDVETVGALTQVELAQKKQRLLKMVVQ